jgi:protein-disulfide isomerase
MYRRKFLAASVSAGAVAVAGCIGGSGGGANDGGDGAEGGGSGATPNATRTETETESSGGGRTLGSHPAATGIDEQPTLGPPAGEATGTIVAFEDPSCPRCKRFEREVFPKIRSNLVDSGEVSYVFRGYPVVYDWGEPAAAVLEATYARDGETFWSMLAHYFENQSEFGRASDSIYEKSRTYLAENTDLDAGAVVADAESGAVDDAVRTDLDAGKAAGAGRTTPHVFLFRDGNYLTKAQGTVSYEIIASSLDL